MIKLTEFLTTPNPTKTKIKFNRNAADVTKRALDFLLPDDSAEDSSPWYEMNAWRTRQASNHLDNVQYLISFAQYYPYGTDYFLFGGLYKVDKIQPDVFDAKGYQLTLMEEYQHYIKRLIIKLNTPIGRNIYTRNYITVQDQLCPEIYELAPGSKLGNFPGYQNVSLKHKQLQLIIHNDEPSWKQALSSVKGVYVVTDTYTGKLYIGSASGNTSGLWQRWTNYANLDNLTGGNIEFEEIIKFHGRDYIVNHFQYSILEIFDTKTKVETVLERENYWKNVLATKKHGMNHN